MMVMLGPSRHARVTKPKKTDLKVNFGAYQSVKGGRRREWRGIVIESLDHDRLQPLAAANDENAKLH